MRSRDKSFLSKREREILEGLRAYDDDLDYEGDGDLVENGGEVWFGLQRTSHRVLYSLLRNCLISRHDDSSDDFVRYRINGWGRLALKDPSFDPQARLVKCIADAENAGREMECGK